MHGPQSTIQDDFDSITAWVEENCMSLNPKKCKEMRISYRAKDLVNETYFEKLGVHKVISITLFDNLRASFCKILISSFAHKWISLIIFL